MTYYKLILLLKYKLAGTGTNSFSCQRASKTTTEKYLVKDNSANISLFLLTKVEFFFNIIKDIVKTYF